MLELRANLAPSEPSLPVNTLRAPAGSPAAKTSCARRRHGGALAWPGTTTTELPGRKEDNSALRNLHFFFGAVNRQIVNWPFLFFKPHLLLKQMTFMPFFTKPLQYSAV